LLNHLIKITEILHLTLKQAVYLKRTQPRQIRDPCVII